MTDTTDIAALRSVCKSAEDCGYVHPVSVDGRLLESLLSQLDASSESEWKLAGDLVDAHNLLGSERQRADANAQEIRRLEFQWEHRAPTQWAYDQACTALHAQRERAEVAEKERDALKSAHGNMVTRCALLRQRTDLPVDRIPAYNSLVKAQEENTELKAKLANPVVLSDCSFEAVSHMAHWYSEGECVAWVSGAEHVKKQILAAGFSVREE